MLSSSTVYLSLRIVGYRSHFLSEMRCVHVLIVIAFIVVIVIAILFRRKAAVHGGGYREEGTFGQNGVKYNLNCILTHVERQKPKPVSISKLDWLLEEAPLEDTAEHRERVERADISAPILVADYEGKLVVVDGMHRLTKAKKIGISFLPSRFISAKVLEKCKEA